VKTGHLYPQRNTGATENVDVEIDDETFDEILSAEENTQTTISGTAAKGYTGNPGQVFVKPTYEVFSVGGIELLNVKVTQCGGSAVPPRGNLYPEGTPITISGVRNF
jgi:hypothetical protein